MFVTERDLDALVLVGLTRYLGADQLARALFPNSDRCTRRARRLFDEGLLQKVVLSSRRPDLLALTGKGIAFVEKRRPEVADRLRLAGPIRVAGVAHHRAVVDARLYAAGVGELRQAPLTRWSGAGDSAAAALALAGLKPDGIAEFAVQYAGTGAELGALVEKKCGVPLRLSGQVGLRIEFTKAK